MRNNIICFTSFPKTSELLHIFATVQTWEKVNTSFYNMVIKKCRQLIFENSNILASPCLEGIYGVHILIKESDYETGELRKYLSNLNLKVGPPCAVVKYIYEECCMYTIIAKLAPKWNLVHQYFVRGRDFLTNPVIKDCVRLSICINDNGDATLIFTVTRINLPTISLEKLEIPNNYVKELKENGVVTFNKCTARQIRVLPSLKRGNILSMCLKPNQNWCFTNYNQFKRHWKNTYGYRLPPTEDNIFYLEISFFDGSPIFTYPSICIRPNEPTFLKRIEAEPVLAGYVGDLMKCMPTIFGETYPIPSYVTQPKPQLFSGAENMDYSNAIPFDLTIKDTQNSAIVYLPTQTQKSSGIKTENDEPKSKLSQLLSQLRKDENKIPIYLTQKTQHTTQNEEINNTTLKPKFDQIKPKPKKQSKLSEQIQSQAQFLSQKLAEQKNTTQTTQKSENKMTPKQIPVFKSKFPKIKPFKTIKSPEKVKKQTKKTQLVSNSLADFNNETPKMPKPKSTSKESNKNNNNNKTKKRVSNTQESIDSLADFDTPKTSVINSKVLNKNNKKEKHANNTQLSIDSLADFDTSKTPVLQINSKESNKNKPNDQNTQSSVDTLADFDTTAKNIATPKISLVETNFKDSNKNKPKNLENISENNNTERKRMSSDNNTEATVVKKPREKPVAVEVNNMKELVYNGDVSKLTIPSLLKWLKDRKVSCNSKEKKSVLIEKIVNVISKE